jgi:hypothetical protein
MSCIREHFLGDGFKEEIKIIHNWHAKSLFINPFIQNT